MELLSSVVFEQGLSGKFMWDYVQTNDFLMGGLPPPLRKAFVFRPRSLLFANTPKSQGLAGLWVSIGLNTRLGIKWHYVTAAKG